MTDARTDSPQEQAWSGPIRATAEQSLRYRLTTSGLVLTLVDPHGSGLWRLSRSTDGLELLTLAGAGPELLRCGYIVDRRGVETAVALGPVSYTHLRAHETASYLVCRLLLEKKK